MDRHTDRQTDIDTEIIIYDSLCLLELVTLLHFIKELKVEDDLRTVQ